MPILVRVIEDFRDKEAGIQRSTGEEFETSKGRFAVLAGANPYRRAFVEMLQDTSEDDVVEETEGAKPLENQTVAELKASLDEKGIEYSNRATKADLIDLHP